MSSFGVVLDACVLFRARLRDTLLRSAEAGLYRVHWSPDIVEETRRNLLRTGRCTEAQAERVVAQMCGFFPEAMAEDYEIYIPSMPVNDKDRHVVAAAVATRSEVIVTDNLKDFPNNLLAPLDIEAQSPDEFLSNLVDRAPGTMIDLLAQQAKDMSRPHRDFNWLLEQYRSDCPDFHKAIMDALKLS